MYTYIITVDQNTNILDNINSQHTVNHKTSSQFNGQKNYDDSFIKTQYFFGKKNLKNNQTYGFKNNRYEGKHRKLFIFQITLCNYVEIN